MSVEKNCDPRDIALKSTFLGPQSENAELVRTLVKQLLEDWFSWRSRLYPADGHAISLADQQSPEFIDRQRIFQNALSSLQKQFEREIPKFSPRYIGHMFSEVSLPALFGHILALLHNPNNISGESSQVGIDIEDQAIGALAKMLGYVPTEVVGHFTSGGTIANIEALSRARSRTAHWLAIGALARKQNLSPESAFQSAHMGWDACTQLAGRLSAISPTLSSKEFNFVDAGPWTGAQRLSEAFGSEFCSPVVLIPENKHYSWTKGVSVLGMGADALWPVKLDEKGNLSVSDLRAQMEKARAALRPITLIVSVAGSTELGHFDPIDQVQDLIDEWKSESGTHIWHHVDAAFGGFFCSMSDEQLMAMSDRAMPALRSIYRADSVTLDPHKLGYVPYSSGAILIKGRKNYDIQSFTAPYVQFRESRDRGPYTLEGSRSAAGAMATWMIDQSVGLTPDGYGRILSRTVSARKELEQALIQSDLPVRVDPYAESNILCFALAREGEPLSLTNKKMERLYERFLPENDSDFFLSKTRMRLGAQTGFLRSMVASWNAQLDSEELTLVRLCLMNPFFSARETKISYINEFVKSLQEKYKSIEM